MTSLFIYVVFLCYFAQFLIYSFQPSCCLFAAVIAIDIYLKSFYH